jgi:MFS family permease
MALRPSRRGFALAALCAVLFLTFLDATIVSVALADIQESLRAGVSSLQWIVNGYLLAFTGLMLTGGALGDLLGRKKVMLAGIAVFCGGSLLAALAHSTGTLIAGRVVMGVGAAACEPGTLSGRCSAACSWPPAGGATSSGSTSHSGSRCSRRPR